MDALRLCLLDLGLMSTPGMVPFAKCTTIRVKGFFFCDFTDWPVTTRRGELRRETLRGQKVW